MPTPLRILIVEDSENDALLLVHDLKRAGYLPEYRRVDTADGVKSAIRETSWDVVVSDFSMPQFDGMSALRLLREHDQETPFIFVSGTIGEETAAEAMRSGAQDYVLKGNLKRLAPAIQRELKDAAVRRERRMGQSRLRSVVDSAMMGIFFWDPNGRINGANDEFLRILGYTRDDQAHHRIDWMTITPPEYREADTRAMAQVADRGACAPYEKEYVRKDGSRVPVLIGGAALEGLKNEGVGFVLDITERRRAQDALSARERQQAAVADLGALAVETADVDALIHRAVAVVRETLDVPRSMVFELGWKPSQDASKSEPITEGSQAEYTLANNQAVIAEDLRNDPRFSRDSLVRERGLVSGATVVVPIQGKPFGVLGAFATGARKFGQDDLHFLQAVAHVLGAAIDRHRADAALRVTQRLESVGRLAGGVAHDFNNLLTAITGYGQLLLDNAPDTDPNRSDLEEILKASQRAASLTRQLLAFSRRQVLESKPLDLNAIVDDMEKMLRRLIGEDIRLEKRLASELGIIQADRGQIEQVILNLVVNARDAMPNGGSVVLETSDKEEPGDGSLTRFVSLSVIDTGIGMDEETRSHIFEPFFTTKGPEKGTGLGLSTVYGIVKQSGGSIAIQSEPGRGATFTVKFPVVAEKPAARVTQANTELVGGTETILLAEDDATVRRLTERILRQAGYQVLVAQNGPTALKISDGHEGPVHLLVSDVVMPEMRGAELARKLRTKRDGIPVLYLSGYTDPGMIEEELVKEKTSFLQKPFTAAVLLQKVREALRPAE